jgi:hypothetical protein
LYIIAPFTAQLEANGLITRLYAIFFAATSSDPPCPGSLTFQDTFNAHVLAPRARTQDGMNPRMLGYPVELAERMTDMTETDLLSLVFGCISGWTVLLLLCPLGEVLYGQIWPHEDLETSATRGQSSRGA